MTTGGYDPNQDPYNQNPQGQPPQGPPPQGYYPPPQGSYPPPTQYGQPQYDQQPPQYGQPQYGQPQYGQQPGYPTPPQFNPNQGGSGMAGDLGSRFAARFIDYVLIAVVSTLLALIIVGFSSTAVGLFAAVIGFAYFVIMETQRGQTVGKMVVGLAVRGPGGAPKPTLKQSAIRNAFVLLAIVPAVIGGILSLIVVVFIAVTINNSATQQGKHDELAGGTQVVKA